MSDGHWLNHSFWDEPSENWKGYVREIFKEEPVSDVIYDCSNQFLHSFRRDYTNPDSIGKDGKPRKYYEDWSHELCPAFYQDVEGWLERGLGRIPTYNRTYMPHEEDKRLIYKGHLLSCEKVPAQCMVICQFVSGTLKELGVPARVRIGFVKTGDAEYSHHNELEYLVDGTWKLVDPTTVPEAKVRGRGFRKITGEDGLGRLIHDDFIHVYEAARLVDERPEIADRFRGATGINKGLRVINGAMTHELFALRNEPITNWKVKEILYKGRSIPMKRHGLLFRNLSHDLEGILVADPSPKDVLKISKKKLDYRLDDGLNFRLDRMGIKHPRDV
jgi:hypothetical protein